MTKQPELKRRIRERMAKTGESYTAARLELTAAGRRVLEAEADHVALNGIDRWIGGVHLQGRAVPWRWDDGTESVVVSPARGGPS